LEAALAMPAVQSLQPDGRIRRVHYDWLEAGEVAQRTVARLSEQLRRYLDDKAWLENKLIMQIIRGIESSALTVRDAAPDGPFMALDEPGPDIELPMDRPLFSPPFQARIADRILVEGGDDVPTNALYEHIYVDKAELAARIRRLLQTRSQISLSEVVATHPLDRGLAEIVAYLSLASESSGAVIDDDDRQTLSRIDAAGTPRRATVPRVVFCR
jgi:hypothetical protein